MKANYLWYHSFFKNQPPIIMYFFLLSLSVNLSSIYLPVRLLVCPTVYLSVYVYLYPPTYLTLCPSIHWSICHNNTNPKVRKRKLFVFVPVEIIYEPFVESLQQIVQVSLM